VARIAITGGTGFVGIHTTKALLRAGHEVRLVARGQRRSPRPPGAESVRGDVVSGRGLVEAFTGCDTVFHLVAVIREKGSQTFDAVNAQGTKNAVDAARQARVGHFIQMSAIGADPDPRYAYHRTKWQGEQYVRAGGVPWTILRSSLVYGPGDGFFTVLTRLVRLNPVVPIVGDGRSLFQPIAVEDVARIVVKSIERGPDGRIHEIGGPDHLSYEDIVDIIKRELGVHRLKARIPVLAMLPLATVMDKVLPNPPVTPGQLRLLERHNITRLDAVPSAFGFQPLAFADNCGYLQNY
jgi:nucleoside-diphosphate-sugar epimerase